MCDRSICARQTSLIRLIRAAHLKLPQSHSLFSRLAFDESEYLPSHLEEGDSSSFPHDVNEYEHAKRETETEDEVAGGGWLEGDDIEDF